MQVAFSFKLSFYSLILLKIERSRLCPLELIFFVVPIAHWFLSKEKCPKSIHFCGYFPQHARVRDVAVGYTLEVR